MHKPFVFTHSSFCCSEWSFSHLFCVAVFSWNVFLIDAQILCLCAQLLLLLSIILFHSCSVQQFVVGTSFWIDAHTIHLCAQRVGHSEQMIKHAASHASSKGFVCCENSKAVLRPKMTKLYSNNWDCHAMKTILNHACYARLHSEISLASCWSFDSTL